MPAYEMTPDEVAQYGNSLTIWQKLALLNTFAPLLAFGQRFIGSPDPYAKAVVISECCEWLAGKTDSGLDDELVKHVVALLKTREGENLVRWAIGKVESMKG